MDLALGIERSRMSEVRQEVCVCDLACPVARRLEPGGGRVSLAQGGRM